MHKKHAFIAAAAGAVVALAMVSGALAAKRQRDAINVDCGRDDTFQVESYGNGGNSNFQPARVIGTNKVVIPVAFANVSGVFTDPDGNTQALQEDDVSRHAPARANLLSCHLSFSSSGPDGSVTFSGDVLGYIAGKWQVARP